MGTAENKETIKRIYAALEHGDRSVFGASVHPDYIWRFPGHCSWSKRFSGQEEVRNRLLKPLFALFATQYKAKAINLIAEGDTVVAEVRGDVQTKAGKRYNNEYCFLFRFRGDKMRSSNIATPTSRSACSGPAMTRSGNWPQRSEVA